MNENKLYIIVDELQKKNKVLREQLHKQNNAFNKNIEALEQEKTDVLEKLKLCNIKLRNREDSQNFFFNNFEEDEEDKDVINYSNELDNTVNELTLLNQTRNKEINYLEEKIDKLEKEKESIEYQKNKLLDKVKQFKKKKKKSIRRPWKKIDKLEKENEGIEYQKNDLLDIIYKLEKENEYEKKSFEIEKTNLNKKFFKKKEKITSLKNDNIALINNYKLNEQNIKTYKNETNTTLNVAEKTLELLIKQNKNLQQQISEYKTKDQTQYLENKTSDITALKLEIEAAKNSLVLKDTELKACLAENANLDITKKNFEQKNFTLFNTLQQTKQTCEESTKNLERDKKALELELEVLRAKNNTERVLVRQLPQVHCRKKRA